MKQLISIIHKNKKSKKLKIISLLLSVIFYYGCSNLKQTNQFHDPNFIPKIEHPKFLKGTGPKVFIDEGHNNYHTMDGRYKPFANLLRKDGHRVFPYKERFTKATLEQVEILIVVNPIHKSNIQSWSLPTPSAFTDTEIVNNWTKAGGKIWIIADHMPIPGTVEKLALSFGFVLQNGFTYGPNNNSHKI